MALRISGEWGTELRQVEEGNNSSTGSRTTNENIKTNNFLSAKSEILKDGTFKENPLFANEQMSRASRSQSRQATTGTATFTNTIANLSI
jgi:hypothetical protein